MLSREFRSSMRPPLLRKEHFLVPEGVDACRPLVLLPGFGERRALHRLVLNSGLVPMLEMLGGRAKDAVVTI